MSEFASLQGMIGVNDTYAPFTLAAMDDLILQVESEGPLYIQVGPRVRKFYRRHFLTARKAWPRRKSYRRAVHRAYRNLGGLP